MRSTRPGKKKSLRIPKGYTQQLNSMLARATAWRKANPHREVLVQFNYPPEVRLIAPIGEALRKKFVVTNPAGRELIDALWDHESPATMVEPTVLMVRVVLEHQPPKEKVFALANTFICPKCGSTLECASATNMIKENPPRGPIAGDISLCMDCGELLEFTDTHFILLAEDRFHELQIKHQIMLRKAQAFVRKRVSRPDKGATDRPWPGEVPPEPGRA